jgi:xanthine dehydrogenase YagS FAD-binding subunit
MATFQYLQPKTLAQASELLVEDPDMTRIVAGGTDLLAEVKDGVITVKRLVSLANLDELKGIERRDEGLRLGAFVTLAELTRDQELADSHPSVVQAAKTVATPQVRNLGTLGGNLCQRPRCLYYRNQLFPCYKKGGSICNGATGYSRNLAILEGGMAYIVHPSDMAPAFIAVGAEVEIQGPQGERRMPLEEFFVGPAERQLHENVLSIGDLVTAVHLPPSKGDNRSVYLKGRDREGEDFALVSVAASVTVEDGTISDVRIILGGVAPTPYRAQRAEEALRGSRVEDADPGQAGAIAVYGARPLKDNGYKVTLAANLVRRALQQLLKN